MPIKGRISIKRRMAIGVGVAIVAAAMPLLTLPASATSNPPWEPDPNTHDTGTLVFYNSAGNVVTGGSNLAHLFDFAEGSSTDPFHGTKATLEFAQPLPAVATGNWAVGAGSLSTAFPNAGAPAPLGTTANPVVTLSSTDANLTNFIATQTPPTAAGFVNVYQVRLITSGPGGTGTLNNDQDYWDADIQVNPTAGTWQEVYPQTGVTAVATTTALAANPAAMAQQGASVSLTATVTASDATHPAGLVEFFQDGISLGAPASVDASTGKATFTTSALLPSAPMGTKLTATFTANDSSTYGPSTSPDLVYTVNPTASVPTLSGPHQVGARETCLEGPLGLLDFGETATFSWQAAGKTVGSGPTLVVPGSAYKLALTCIATVQEGSGPKSSATSLPVIVILGKAPRNTKRPTLSGPHRVGKREIVNHGSWSPSSVTFTYQWLLNGRVIRGATRSTLTLTRADKGRKISCRVTAHKAGYANGVATTASVKVTS